MVKVCDVLIVQHQTSVQKKKGISVQCVERLGCPRAPLATWLTLLTHAIHRLTYSSLPTLFPRRNSCPRIFQPHLTPFWELPVFNVI